MKADMLLDAIGNVEDAYIVSVQKRLADAPAKGTGHGRSGYRKFLLAAAAVLLLMVSSFTAAMAVNAEFRNAVFRFFHILDPVTVPPAGEDAWQQEPIEYMGNLAEESAVNVEYIRVKGSHGHTDSRGIIFVNFVSDAENEEGLRAYAIKDGQLFQLTAHQETFEYAWKDVTYRISFDWYDDGGTVTAAAEGFDMDTSASWSVQSVEGNSEFVKLTLGYGAQIEYTMYPMLYDLRTHEVVDVLGGCGEISSQNLIGAEFSSDLSKLLVTCGENVMWYDEYAVTVYCYDIEKQEPKLLSEWCRMNVMEAWFIDRDTIGCLWYDEDFNYTLKTVALSSGECLEMFAGMPDLSWSQDDTGISFSGRRYGLLVEDDSSTFVYDFKTGETVLLDGFVYSADFSTEGFNGDGTKLLLSRESLEEDVWVIWIGILDLEKKLFVSFDREGSGVPREYSISWFDNERVGIWAHTEEDSYLYLFTTDEPADG